MAQTKSGNLHGLYRVQVGLVGSNGYGYGTAGQSLATNGTSHAYLLKYPKSAELPQPDRTNIDFTGGDAYVGSFMYGITSLGSFNLVLSNLDATFVALTTGSSVDQTTNQLWTIFGENINDTDLPQMYILLTYRIQSRESGSDGNNLWITTVIPRCTIAPKGASPSFQSAVDYTFQVTPTMSDTMPIGVAFGANQNFQDNRTNAFHIISDYPIAHTTYVGNGVATTFTTGYRPRSSTITINNAPNLMAKNGTVTALSSIVTTTGVATLATAGTSGDIYSIFYETNFQTI